MYPQLTLFYKDKLMGKSVKGVSGYASSMLTAKLSEDLPIGTPCLAWVDAFIISDSAVDTYINEFPPNSNLFERKVDVVELFDIGLDPWVVSDIVSRSLNKAYIVHLFTANMGTNQEYLCHQVSTKNFLLTPATPIIYDNGEVVVIEKPKEVFKDLSQILTGLQHKRYITFVLVGASQSDIKSTTSMLNTLMSNLRGIYPQSIAFHTANLRSLVDIVAVSFYHMEDMIAVFDKSKKGIGVEIYLTNSVWAPEEIAEKSGAYRFLFSKSKENLFTIDGESIKRSSDMKVDDAMEILTSNINHHLPAKLDVPKKGKGKSSLDLKDTQKAMVNVEIA